MHVAPDVPVGRRTALRVLGGTAMSVALGGAGIGIAAAARDLPRLDAPQLGQLAFIDRLARQLPSDWVHMGSEEPGQGGFDAYRYQLAMMSYALSLAQYHYTPAWRERPMATSRKLIDKMLQFDVWGFWELTSRGFRGLEPDLTALRESMLDPVWRQNVMYSGHLFQMVAAHQMLFDDASFDKAGSILFDYSPVARGMGPQRFEYDIHRLAEVLVDQFRLNGWRGIECEPNAIFPECNQHPMLGFALYDARHGTDRFKQIAPRFREQYDRLGYLDQATGSVMAYYLVKQDEVVRHDSAWSDGWTGTFLHGWHRAEPEATYPRQRARFITRLPDGTATVRGRQGDGTYSHGHGFMAALAAELGDTDTQRAMLSYADRYWEPVWEGAALRYPRHDAYRRPDDAADVWRRVQPLTGNGLIALARMGGKDRLFTMFDQPFDASHFARTRLAGIDYPAIQVARAAHDAAGALHFDLRPARDAPQARRTSFRIERHDPGQHATLLRDEQPLLTVRAGNLRVLTPQDVVARLDATGAILVETPIEKNGSSFRFEGRSRTRNQT